MNQNIHQYVTVYLRYLMLVSADNLYKFEITGQVASPMYVDHLLINCLLILHEKNPCFWHEQCLLEFPPPYLSVFKSISNLSCSGHSCMSGCLMKSHHQSAQISPRTLLSKDLGTHYKYLIMRKKMNVVFVCIFSHNVNPNLEVFLNQAHRKK